jgi:hypothetical protein
MRFFRATARHRRIDLLGDTSFKGFKQLWHDGQYLSGRNRTVVETLPAAPSPCRQAFIAGAHRGQ